MGGIGSAIASLVGWFNPNLGRGYLGISPALAINNHSAALRIAYSLELGDQIKSMIEQGKTRNGIKLYLAGLRYT